MYYKHYEDENWPGWENLVIVLDDAPEQYDNPTTGEKDTVYPVYTFYNGNIHHRDCIKKVVDFDDFAYGQPSELSDLIFQMADQIQQASDTIWGNTQLQLALIKASILHKRQSS